MKKNILTFRFDDENHSLSRENGFPINILSDFLQSLFKVSESLSKDIMLYEVRGNCYAMDIISHDLSVIGYLQDLHDRISENNIISLNRKEIEYTRKIDKILSERKIYLNVKNDGYNKVIKEIKFPEIYPYHYETDSIKGIIIKIGSKTESSQATIGVSNYPGGIQITTEQERELKSLYKDAFIDFYITKRINTDDGKTEETILDGYRVVKPNNFYDTIKTIRSKYGSDLYQIESGHE